MASFQPCSVPPFRFSYVLCCPRASINQTLCIITAVSLPAILVSRQFAETDFARQARPGIIVSRKFDGKWNGFSDNRAVANVSSLSSFWQFDSVLRWFSKVSGFKGYSLGQVLKVWIRLGFKCYLLGQVTCFQVCVFFFLLKKNYIIYVVHKLK